MKEEDTIYLKHILENIEKMEISFKSKTKKQFEEDVDLQDATFRRIEVIGEAVKNISEELKKKNPKVEWRKIADTRNVLIHAYFSVDAEIVFGIVKKDIPKLKKQILLILKGN